jgi:hypothetical protein
MAENLTSFGFGTNNPSIAGNNGSKSSIVIQSVTQGQPVETGPLSGLSKTLGMSTLSYPSDLGTGSSKKHYVTFLAKEITPQSYNDAIKELGAAVGTALDDASAAAAKAKARVDEIRKAESAEQADGMIASTFSNITDAAMTTTGDLIQGGKNINSLISGSMDIRKNRTSVKSYISLYMPDTIQANYQANWADFSMRDALGERLQAIRAVGEVAGTGIESFRANKVLEGMSSNPQMIKYIIDRTTQDILGGSEQLSASILQASGLTSNPQLQMIYSGTQFRSFNLSFIFTPKSKDESLSVQAIIHQFKYYAAPALQHPGKSPNSSMFLTPPALFEVRFYYDGSENINLPRYTDCVLKDISIDYAPNGWSAHMDGAPIQTQLSLSFEEIEIVDKDRLNKGYFSKSDGLR